MISWAPHGQRGAHQFRHKNIARTSSRKAQKKNILPETWMGLQGLAQLLPVNHPFGNQPRKFHPCGDEDWCIRSRQSAEQQLDFRLCQHQIHENSLTRGLATGRCFSLMSAFTGEWPILVILHFKAHRKKNEKRHWCPTAKNHEANVDEAHIHFPMAQTRRDKERERQRRQEGKTAEKHERAVELSSALSVLNALHLSSVRSLRCLKSLASGE